MPMAASGRRANSDRPADVGVARRVPPPTNDLPRWARPCYNGPSDAESSRLPVWRSFTGVKEMGGPAR